MAEWYRETYGEDVVEERPPLLILRPGQSVTVEFTEETCKVIQTKRGKRAVILVRVTSSGKLNDVRALLIGHKVLARKIAMLEIEHGNLHGLVVKITNMGRTERGYYDYDVELVETRG